MEVVDEYMVAVLSVCIYACSLLMFEVQYHFWMTSIRYEFPTFILIQEVTKNLNTSYLLVMSYQLVSYMSLVFNILFEMIFILESLKRINVYYDMKWFHKFE